MPRQERRRQVRKTETVPITVSTTASLNLEGQTLNLSDGGIFFAAPGRLEVVVNVKGDLYRAHLVRAFPTEDGMTAYAVELEGLLKAADAPVNEAVPVEA